MYSLLTSKESHLPTVISTNSRDYADLMLSGMYIEEDTGTKREMEDAAQLIIDQLYSNVD